MVQTPSHVQAFLRYAPFARQARAVALIALKGEEPQAQIGPEEDAIHSAHLERWAEVAKGPLFHATWTMVQVGYPSLTDALVGANLGSAFTASTQSADAMQAQSWAADFKQADDGRGEVLLTQLTDAMRRAAPKEGWEPYSPKPTILAEGFARHAAPSVQAAASLVLASKVLIGSEMSPSEDAVSRRLSGPFLSVVERNPTMKKGWMDSARAVCNALPAGFDIGQYLLSAAYQSDDGAQLTRALESVQTTTPGLSALLVALNTALQGAGP